MIIFWNQREVFVGYSMEKFNEVRSILAANKIKYKYRLVNCHSGSRRARTGSFGINMAYAYQYYVYVHKRDYDYACAVLRNA